MRILVTKESWCRDSKCVHHPANKFIKISLNYIRCFGCKLYISKDLHEDEDSVKSEE